MQNVAVNVGVGVFGDFIFSMALVSVTDNASVASEEKGL